MKLVRYGKPGKEKPGMIDAEGRLRDLSGVVPDIGPAQLSPKSLAKLAKIKDRAANSSAKAQLGEMKRQLEAQKAAAVAEGAAGAVKKTI